MADYLPGREAELVTWSTVFDQQITAKPGDFGLDAAQAAAYNVLHSAWVSAYNVANDGTTRTPSAIQTKNDAKQALIRGPGGIRELVGVIQKYPAITNALRAAINITIPEEPTPVPPPVEPPEMDIMKVTGRTVQIRLHNDTILQRKRPVGVKGAAVFTWVGDTTPDNLDDWRFEGNTSKTLIDIEFPMTVPAGSKVWITAFWLNAKMQSGPPCEPDATYLAGGLSKAA